MAFFYSLFTRKKKLEAEAVIKKEQEIDTVLEVDDNREEDLENVLLVDIDSEQETFENHLTKLLKKDFQLMGNQDAYANPNSSYMDLGVELIKTELETSLLNLKGKVVKRMDQVKAWKDLHKGLGQIDTVNRLDAVIQYLNEFKKRIEEIEKGNEENKGESARITLTYKRGFIKGIEAIAYSKYLK